MELMERAKIILRDSMGVQPGETVLTVTDDGTQAIGQAFYRAAAALGAESLLMQMADRQVSGQEPPTPVAEAMRHADVVLCPTVESLTHTNARIGAVKNGARVATLPGITEEMFSKGAICADYPKVEALTNRVVALLDKAEIARLVKDGHTLTLNLKGRSGVASTGIYRKPGQAGNLPSGEAYIAPLEDGCHGEMIVDGSFVGIGKLDEPVWLRVEDGKLREIRGKDSEKLSILLENDSNATLGELGIGTNDAAILSGIILEDEKVYGTVHIAFGTNTSFGGVNKAGCHMDGVILSPDLYLDDVPVLKDGKFVI